MKPLVRLEATGPLYQRIYRALRREILAGRLAPGARLASTRALAEELSVSRNSTLLAYEQLFAEGYIEGKAGSGTHVTAALPDPALAHAARSEGSAGPPRSRAPRLSAFGRRIGVNPPRSAPNSTWLGRTIRYDFRYGIPAVAALPHRVWRRLTHTRLRAGALGTSRYTQPEGDGRLRTALAKYLNRERAIAAQPDQVVIVNGSQQALDLAARVLLDVGDRVVVEEPHSRGACEVFQSAGARFVSGPVDGDGLNVTTLPRTARDARLAYVTPSHQFPTGAVMSVARRLSLLAWASDRDAYILEHDIDGEYRYQGRPIEAVQALDRTGRVLYVGAFSRVLFPSLRLGYMVLPASLVSTFRAAKLLADRHTPTLQQDILADLLENGDLERLLRRARVRYASRRAALLAALAKYASASVEVEGANAGTHVLVWLRRPDAQGLPKLVERAAQAGIAVYPATPYYFRPPRRAGLVLAYVGMPEEDIDEGIRRLAALLPDTRSSGRSSSVRLAGGRRVPIPNLSTRVRCRLNVRAERFDSLTGLSMVRHLGMVDGAHHSL